MENQNDKLPIDRFEARLALELEERIEFGKWKAGCSGSSSKGGSAGCGASWSSS
jgi:hypothetical protein